MLALALAIAGIGPARGDDVPGGSVEILTVNTPTSDPATPGGKVSISGTFTNTSGQPLARVTAELWHDHSDLSSFEALSRALGAPVAELPRTTIQPGQVLTPDTTLAPGASVPFQLTTTVGALGVGKDELAGVVGVQIRATTAPAGTGPVPPKPPADTTQPLMTLAQDKVVLPRADHPFAGTGVVLLTAPPGMVPDSQRIPAELRAAIEGPLTEALTAAEQPSTTTLIDPQVYRAAHLLATGRQRSETAQEFVDRVDELHRRGTLRRLPHGNPDLNRLPDDVRAHVVQWSLEFAPEQLRPVPLAAITHDETLARTLSTGTAGYAEVYLGVPADDGGQRWFVLGPHVTPDPRAPFQASPAQPGTPSAVPGTTWNSIGQLFETAAKRTGLRTVLTGHGEEEPVDLRPLRLAAYSSNFPDEPSALTYVMSSPAAMFDPTRIDFQASPSFVMGQRESDFPTTITNKSGVPIHVRVVFSSDNPLRLSVPDSDLVRVGPGEALTLPVTPQASSNGVTAVHAHLEAADQTRLSPDVTIEVTATEFGRIGWIIIIVSGAVVLGGTVLRIQTVQKERGKESSESGQ